MYEVAERFYMELIPQAREIAAHAAENGNQPAADSVNLAIDEILARPEHQWFEKELKPRDAEPADGETQSVDAQSPDHGSRKS
jgi:hypothetical protein